MQCASMCGAYAAESLGAKTEDQSYQMSMKNARARLIRFIEMGKHMKHRNRIGKCLFTKMKNRPQFRSFKMKQFSFHIIALVLLQELHESAHIHRLIAVFVAGIGGGV